MRVLVTGGKGDLRRRVVSRLEEQGHEVQVGTRSPQRETEFRFDLVEGIGEGELREGDTLVHLASDSFHPDEDVRGTAALFEAAARAGVGHLVFMSIVGIDSHPFRYYRTRKKIEEELEANGLPYSILRATQFHSFIARLVDEFGSRFRAVPVPGGIPLRPVDADTVADRLAELVEAGPSGRVKDLAGPEVLELDRMPQGGAGCDSRCRCGGGRPADSAKECNSVMKWKWSVGSYAQYLERL